LLKKIYKTTSQRQPIKAIFPLKSISFKNYERNGLQILILYAISHILMQKFKHEFFFYVFYKYLPIKTTKNATDKTKLNDLTQQLKCEIINLKQSPIKCYLRELTNERSTDYLLWRVTRKLKKPTTYRVIHERGTSEFLFCRNQQYQWQ
jgi:predicted acetyltransferase